MGYEFDYSKLKGRITEKFGTQSSFAKAVKRTDTYVSMVLNGKSYLDQTEIEKWSSALEIECEMLGVYFFTKKVRETELKGG